MARFFGCFKDLAGARMARTTPPRCVGEEMALYIVLARVREAIDE